MFVIWTKQHCGKAKVVEGKLSALAQLWQISTSHLA
jgi:hypothetical protein